MNIYLQILTHVQTCDVAQLMLIPSMGKPEQVGCRIRCLAGGRVWSKKADSIGKLLQKKALDKFNEIEITYLLSSDSGFPWKTSSVVGLFAPSPTCDMWYGSEEWPLGGDRVARDRRMNAKAAEIGLSYYKLEKAPSVFKIAIAIDSTDKPEKILDSCAEWIVNYFNKGLEHLQIFGCADIGGMEFFVKLETNVLMTAGVDVMAKLFPPTYSELGKRFDRLHPVMFGDKQVCQSIGLALKEDARIVLGRDSKDFAAIRVIGGCKESKNISRASDWILIKD